MKLTQDIIRQLILEELGTTLQEVDKSELRSGAVTTIASLMTRLDAEGIDPNAVVADAESAFRGTDGATKQFTEAHDHEDDMAKRQMYKTARDASQVFEMIQSGDNYPAWLQSKMTKVADYIGVIKNYLEYDHVVGEKLDKDADAGDYVKDFQDSDAPQFKGKSKKKKQKMAIAAYLDAQEDK